MNDQNVCPNIDTHYSTKCILRQLNGESAIIVPTYDVVNNTSCTAVFDLKKLMWHKIYFDSYLIGRGGHMISFDNASRILYLGGFDVNEEKSKIIHELIGDEYWETWSVKLPVPIGNDTIISIPNKASLTCTKQKTSLGNF